MNFQTSTDVSNLLAQRAELDRQINALRAEKRGQAIAEVRARIAEYELTPEELFGVSRPRRASSTTGSVVPPKYRNPVTGDTWTGRGKPPVWIRDKNRDDFLIQK